MSVAILEAPPPRGRRGALAPDARRAKLLATAEAVFLERGYAAASMDEVAKRAGMSKRTLYGVFPTKAGLFADVARSVLAADCPSSVDEGTGTDAVTALGDYLQACAASMLSTRRIGLLRVVISESTKAPELTEAFYDTVVRQVPMALAEWIDRRRALGLISVQDSREAAHMLFGMALGHPHMMRLVGQEPPGDDALRSRIDRAVRIFLLGSAP